MASTSFAIISEGVTDQVILENLLIGYFKAHGDAEPTVTRIQPPFVEPPSDPAPGGWTLVVRALKEGRPADALAFNDYVIVQIDTDVAEQPGFDVSYRHNGQERSVEELVAAVRERLIAAMPPVEEAELRCILFAIAVHQTECWLLPLVVSDNRTAKLTGCLDTLNRALRRKNLSPVSNDRGVKSFTRYQQLSKDLRRSDARKQARNINPSLTLFLDNLDRALGHTREPH